VLQRCALGEDGRSLSLQLRPQVVFHDHHCFTDGQGRAATSADLVYSLELAARRELPLPITGLDAFLQGEAEHLSGVVFKDGLTVELQLDEARPYAVHPLALVWLLPAELEGCEEPDDLSMPVGTGPFRFVERPSGERVRLQRAPAYWRQEGEQRLPLSQGLEIEAVSDPVEALSRLSGGDLQLLQLVQPGEIVVQRDGEQGLAPEYGQLALATEHDPRRRSTLLLNFLGKPGPLQEPALRRAVALSLDRAVLAAAYPRPLQASGRLLQEDLLGHDPAADGLALDRAQARDLLAAAGFPDGAELPTLSMGLPLSAGEEIGPLLEAQLGETGIPIELRRLSSEALPDVLASRSLDMVLVEIRPATFGRDPYPAMITWPGVVSRFGFPDQALEELGAQARSELDRRSRGRIYREMELRLLQSLPVVPLGFGRSQEPSSWVLHGDGLQGLADPLTGRLAGDLEERWALLAVQP